jgi:hypothetical protein
MIDLEYILLTDGTSDRMLLPILDWLLSQHNINPQGQRADFSCVPSPPRSLSEKITQAWNISNERCKLLFIHRDAEREGREKRLNEIELALQSISEQQSQSIPVIPVRMSEAWLLFDEPSIRQAAGNPNGTIPLSLPSHARVESLPDPKDQLCQLLRQACGLSGRRLEKFKASERQKIINLAELIQDFSPLRQLTAFQSLEADIRGFATFLASHVGGDEWA